MKKLLIPAFVLSFSVAQASEAKVVEAPKAEAPKVEAKADAPAVSFLDRVLNRVDSYTPGCILKARTYVEETIALHPKKAVLVAFVAGVLAVKAIDYVAAETEDEDSGF